MHACIPGGPADDPRFIQVRYSDDGGENWSQWRDIPSGATGGFLQLLIARRLGRTRHRIWEIRDTSQAPQDVLAASIIVESE